MPTNRVEPSSDHDGARNSTMRMEFGKALWERGSSSKLSGSSSSRSRHANATCAVSSYASSSNVFRTARSADSSRHERLRYVAASVSRERSCPLLGLKTDTPLPTCPSASVVSASRCPPSCQENSETLPKLITEPVAIVRITTSTPSLSLSSGL